MTVRRWAIAGLLLSVAVTAEAGREGAGEKACDRRAEALRRELGGRGFTVLVEPPFVVVGDEAPIVVQERAERTVRWAVRLLKKDFFKRDPKEVVTIWLFKDGASFRAHSAEFFGEKPTTPFGYYSPAHRALVMNIATGGGTLVHEIVHAFMRTDFPACPPWLNEGLASLYEQCTERDGHIHGLTNWRLAGLQKAIRAGKVPPFERLLAADEDAFYGRDEGTNYAQARYLCYWLQEKGLLVKFFRTFREACRDDPTGVRTLKKVLDEPDLSRFQKQWQRFVLDLHFP